MSNHVRVGFDTLRSLAFGSVTGSYVIVGTAFANPVRMLKVVNTTDANIIISYDGVNDQDFVAAGTAFIYDYAANLELPGGQFDQKVGAAVYVKEESGAPTLGNIRVTVIYAAGNNNGN